jgi:AcrR family transcriptional regulator
MNRLSEKHDSREMILKTATNLFAEKGYASTSVREIVTRAGVTKPVLYYYFKNKDDVLLTILDRAADLQKEVLAEIKKTVGSVFERLILFYSTTQKGIQQNKSLFNLIHNLIFGPPQGTPDYDFSRYQQRMVDTITNIYHEGYAKGEIKETDPEEFAILVLALFDYCLHLDMVDPDRSDPQRAERLLKLAFEGLKKGM